MQLGIVVVGGSLGGFSALQQLLAALPGEFAAPLAAALHRGPDHQSNLAELLETCTPLQVREPEDKEEMRPGTVYLAPADYHLLVEPGYFSLSVDEPVNCARPSIDVLFESAAEAFGPAVAGVLLTSSSRDGAAGIAAIASGGGVTVVQDPASAFSPVGPQSALEQAPVRHVLPLEQIAPLLVRLISPSHKG